MENIKNRFWCRKNSSKQLILLILLFVSLLLMIFAFLFRSILFTKDNTRHIWEEDISVEYVFPLGIYQEQIYMEYGFEGVDYLSYQRSNMNVPIYQSNNESGVLFRSQGDNDWESFFRIKELGESKNNVFFFEYDLELDTFFTLIIDANGAGSGEGIGKLVSIDGGSWDVLSCFYYMPDDWVIDDSLGIRDRVDLYVENNSQYVMDLGYSHCRDFELVF